MRKESIKEYRVGEIRKLSIGHGADFHVRDLVRNSNPDIDTIESDTTEDEELYLVSLHCSDGDIRVGIYSNNAWTDMSVTESHTLAEYCDEWDDDDNLPEIVKCNRK